MIEICENSEVPRFSVYDFSSPEVLLLALMMTYYMKFRSASLPWITLVCAPQPPKHHAI